MARKHNKMGQRFAFVSFANVKDKYDLELGLCNIKIGENKLFVSIAKFVDDEVTEGTRGMNKNQTRESRNVLSNDKGKSPQVVEPSSVQESSDLGIGTSFKETLTKNIINNIDLIELAPNINAFSQWHDKEIVGRVIDFTKLITLKGWLHGKDLKKVHIKYIGGTSVLLIFDTIDSANSFEPREWVPDFLEEDGEDGSQIGSECNMEEEKVDDRNPKKSDDVSEPENESDIDMVNQVTHANLDSIDDTNHVHIEGGNNLVSNDEENVSHNVESQTNDRFENSLGNDNYLDNNKKSIFFKYSFRNIKKGDKSGLKKFKKLDQKGRAQSKSPQDRPKKRARSGDPFGLNSLLGIEDNTTSPS
ncbi:hypothetical protein Hanom_Chr12g01093291 [Helianthus anomalus]